MDVFISVTKKDSLSIRKLEETFISTLNHTGLMVVSLKIYQVIKRKITEEVILLLSKVLGLCKTEWTVKMTVSFFCN